MKAPDLQQVKHRIKTTLKLVTKAVNLSLGTSSLACSFARDLLE